MTKPALEEIIAIEREIQTHIDGERRAIETWRTEQQESIARESETRLAAHRLECDLMIARAEEEARQEIAAQAKEQKVMRPFLTISPIMSLRPMSKNFFPGFYRKASHDRQDGQDRCDRTQGRPDGLSVSDSAPGNPSP